MGQNSTPMNKDATQPDDPVRQLRHDLRTPINHIIGCSELILEELPDNVTPHFHTELLLLVKRANETTERIDNYIQSPKKNRSVEMEAIELVTTGILHQIEQLVDAARKRGLNDAMKDFTAMLGAARKLDEKLKTDLPRVPLNRPAPNIIDTKKREWKEEAKQDRLPTVKAATKGKRVLVVDDTKANRDILRRMLRGRSRLPR
ncbi:MAG: hypothetical protein AAF492_23675 [Verrucomicrobiota bacterium]